MLVDSHCVTLPGFASLPCDIDKWVRGLQTPLAGFRLVPNVYRLYQPDRLHQSNLGAAHVHIRLLQQMYAAQLEGINRYLYNLPIMLSASQILVIMGPAPQTVFCACMNM